MAEHADLNLTGDFSVAFWVRQAEGNRGYFLNRNNETNEKIYYALFNYGTKNKFYFQYQTTEGVEVENWEAVRIDDGRWHRVAFVVGDGVSELFVDNVSVGRRDLDGAMLGANEPTEIGRRRVYEGASDWSTRYFEGSLDDFRIYRAALTPAQITGIYNQ